ncbi:MAG: hypothetical protein JJU00_05660 [Opitutales bacterium]|nr:hypothetical protein [Opitutales bacterium]
MDAHFIGLASSALSRARVHQRVTEGGHDVPDQKIEARFARTLANLERLIPVANRLTIYDNSTVAHPNRPVALFKNGRLTAVSGEVPPWLAFLDLPARTEATTTRLP